MKFIEGSLIEFKTEFKVVVLPLPVGPVKNISPWGESLAFKKSAFCLGSKPSLSTFNSTAPLSINLMTSFSPKTVGHIETRVSIILF